MMLKEKLKDKKILFFSVQFFNIEKEIINKLEEVGAKVDYFDERPSNSIFVKGIIRLKKSLYQKKINAYYRSILKKIEGEKYDFLFVIRGEVVPEFFLKEFIIKQKRCINIFYTWDSFKNCNHAVQNLKYFNKKFTFDREDAINFKIDFRPLFFLDSFKRIKTKNEYKIDLLCIGTAHSDRYVLTNKVVDWCNLNLFKTHIFFYSRSRLVFAYKFFIDSSFKKFDYNKISFKSLDKKEIINLYSNSKIILDINHPDQKGLTMRTFEAIGAQKKLITSNEDIKKYSFYNPNNIKVISRKKPKLEVSFFYSKYEPIEDFIYKKSSIEGWLESLFLYSKSNIWLNKI